MGIRGLQTYIERNCGETAWYWVDIRELADDARRRVAERRDTRSAASKADHPGEKRDDEQKMYTDKKQGAEPSHNYETLDAIRTQTAENQDKGIKHADDKCDEEGSVEKRDKKLTHTDEKHVDDEWELVVAVDGMACMRKVYQGLDWMCGGQFRDYIARMRSFFDAFTAIGVRPVVFLAGVFAQEKMNIWSQRRMTSVQEMKELFDQLHAGEKPKYDVKREWRHFPCGTPYSLAYMVAHLCGVEVRTCFSDDSDREIATYCRSRGDQCIAVFSKDTDFVILDTGCVYLSIEHFNEKSMLARIYDRYELCKHLDLSPDHLPLLSCLLGNDYFPPSQDPSLHPPFWLVISRVADFLRGFSPGTHTQRNLYNIVCTVFSCSADDYNNNNDIEDNMSNNYEKRTRLLEVICDSIDSQCNDHRAMEDDNWRQTGAEKGCEKAIHELDVEDDTKCVQMTKPTETELEWACAEAKRRLANHEQLNFCFPVLSRRCFEISTCLEDFRCTETLPPTATLFRPLRQHAYWVLLCHGHSNGKATSGKETLNPNSCGDLPKSSVTGESNEPLTSVSESCIHPDTDLKQPELIKSVPILGHYHHPGLRYLWTDQSREADDLRWEMLISAVTRVSAKPTPAKAKLTREIRSLPEDVIVPMLVLIFIQNHRLANGDRILLEWELDSILAMVLFLRQCSIPFADDQRPPPASGSSTNRLRTNSYKIQAQPAEKQRVLRSMSDTFSAESGSESSAKSAEAATLPPLRRAPEIKTQTSTKCAKLATPSSPFAHAPSNDARSIQIGSMFLRGILNVSWLSDALGHPIRVEHTKPWLFFDGLWFQHFYNRAKQLATENSSTKMNAKMFREIRHREGNMEGHDAGESQRKDAHVITETAAVVGPTRRRINDLCDNDRQKVDLLLRMKSLIEY